MNFEDWSMVRLEEIELKYVDLTLPELRHLLKNAPRLRIAAMLFFTPIPEQADRKVIPVSDFLYLIACVLADRSIHQLIFLDYKLPAGEQKYRQEYLGKAAKKYDYNAKWSDPKDLEYDHMEFKIRVE